MRHFSKLVLLPGVLAFLMPVPQARAGTVYAWECGVAAFWCGNPVGVVPVGAGVASDFVNPLGIGGTSVVPFAFLDAITGNTFNGVFTATNLGGVVVSLDGIGTATWNQAAGGFLDVYMTQGFVMNPLVVGAIGGAAEFMNGNCNAAAAGAGDNVQGQLYANGTLLPVMGGAGDCAGAPAVGFNFASGFFPSVITQPYVLAGGAQFTFAGNAIAGGPESIDLPYGDSEEAPEPVPGSLLGSGLIGLAFVARRLRR